MAKGRPFLTSSNGDQSRPPDAQPARPRSLTGAARSSGLAIAVAAALLLAACGFRSPADQAAGRIEEKPAATTIVATGSASTPAAAVTPSAEPSTPQPATASPTPGGSANVDISPSEVTVGGVTLTLALQSARHMFDQASLANSEASGDPSQPAQDKTKSQPKGSAVFSGGMLRVANNIDASQSPPADSAQGILRHIVVLAKTKAGQIIPYLDLTMDLLLDGRPTIFDQALVPMVAVDGNSPQLYYGNNVKFPRRGTYQVFVRTTRNPLLGQDQPPAAQFNLSIR